METYQMVKSEARSQLSQANHDVPTYWNEISLCAKHAMRATRVASDSMIGGVIENARRSALRASTEVEDGISGLASSAKFSIREGKTRSEGMMREIAGQGPEKTLQRGFALVRDDASNPITRAAQIGQASTIEIQFFDGHVLAGTGKQH
jgi:exodeoxyribonuclease VII large subunit